MRTYQAMLRYIKRWKKRNPDKVRQHRKTWRLRHPDYLRNWRRNNPEKVKAYKRKERS